MVLLAHVLDQCDAVIAEVFLETVFCFLDALSAGTYLLLLEGNVRTELGEFVGEIGVHFLAGGGVVGGEELGHLTEKEKIGLKCSTVLLFT